MSHKKTIIDAAPARRAQEEKRPSLTVMTENDFGRQYPLGKDEIIIGRDEECDIRVSDDLASRRHARIVGDSGLKTGPYFKVIDLGSTNGTQVNGRRVSEAALTDGDRLHVGGTVFKYSVRDVCEVDLEKKIYRMATTDTLTGLSSREHFLRQVEDTFHRSERYQRPFSLMMADIDDFKAVNDTHGHPVGDVVLEAIGGIIMDIIRHEDCAARYGGEEFIVLLPETPTEKALFPAERLRRNVEAFEFQAEKEGFHLTASVGIAGFPEHAATVDELIEKVDQALYEAKRSGKNAVRVFNAVVESQDES